jgi:hypothetical protein
LIVVRNLKPSKTVVDALPYPASGCKVTGDMPRTVIEVAGITWPDVLALDEIPIQPKLPQAVDIRPIVDQISTVFHYFELVSAALHCLFPLATRLPFTNVHNHI